MIQSRTMIKGFLKEFIMELDRLKLKAAEREFSRRFPEGFSDPEMQAIGKKHAMNRMVSMAQEL